MRLTRILPTVDPTARPVPTDCPHAGCGSHHGQLHQEVPKPLRDTQLDHTTLARYRCVRCGHTVRVYPSGVSRAHTAARVRGVAVMRSLLGLSYGAAALAQEALGFPLRKSAVYDAVQAAGERVPGLRRSAVRIPVGQVVVAALGADLTSVKCAGQWLTVGVGVDAVHGLALTVDVLDSAEAATLTEWIGDIATVVGATVLVSDDADGVKAAASQTGLDLCTAHVTRNTDAWAERMVPVLARDADGSLAAIGVASTQAVAAVEMRCRLMRERDPTPAAARPLREIHLRYLGAASPRQTRVDPMSDAYKLRLFRLDRWSLWEPLTRSRSWSGPDGEELDGTNTATERAIGWWGKERYRTMRGDTRRQSVTTVSRLIAWAGTHLAGAGAALALVTP
jgi:hypothetical protein